MARGSQRTGDGPARRTLTVSALRAGDGRTDVPWLRLSGHWLRRAGFAPGETYTVIVEQGRLVLEASRPEPSDPDPRGATP
jgi:hypothetical protein